jgi:hemerythrin-like domain-containing protein
MSTEAESEDAKDLISDTPENVMELDWNRRNLLRQSSVAGLTLMAAGLPFPTDAPEAEKKEPEVTATEDLMREHGVIRRALLIYFEVVPKLRKDAASVDLSALRQTAQLFRTFGEDYHERILEEQHIFPLIRKQGDELERYADILTMQHNRGREVTDYILAVTRAPRISVAHAEPLARTLESFVLMYENHAAREDTVVFPAWKKNFSNQQLDAVSDQFEDIEHRMFGKDGFEDAEKKIGTIEGQLGFSDLAQFTPPPPPRL